VNKQTGHVKKRFDSNQATDLSLPLPQVSNTVAGPAFAPRRV